MQNKKILVIDDSRFFLEQTKDILMQEGYEIFTAASGEEGLHMVRVEKPDLVILDIIMPEMDGFEVCRVLRESESNNLMPIIMVTSQDDQEKKLRGLDLGADDYILKPFDPREIISRIRNTLKRIERSRAANPLTGLSGNLEIQREIIRRIEKQEPFAIVYADLNEFKAFNDAYGFAKGDSVIKMTADIIKDQVGLFGKNDDFIGHIGGDDFIFITTPDVVEDICNNIIEQFTERITGFYSAKDVANGFIATKNRKGEKSVFPIMSIALAAVTTKNYVFKTYQQVAKVATELKKKVKSMPGSNYIEDRRTKTR